MRQIVILSRKRKSKKYKINIPIEYMEFEVEGRYLSMSPIGNRSIWEMRPAYACIGLSPNTTHAKLFSYHMSIFEPAFYLSNIRVY